jgi:hypothetical protein
VSAGVSLGTAAELVGIHPTCAREWMQRGKGEDQHRPQTPLYKAFSEAITKAQAQDQVRRIARLEQAGRGGAVVYRETTTHRDGSTTVRERFEPPNIQADMFHLERRYHEDWGRKDRVDLKVTIQQTAQKVAEALGLTVEEVLAEAQLLLTEADRADP